jgi:hypothetical protein
MDWADLGLHAVRAAGALASALAGVAALFTDGAFKKRPRPLGGWWKDSPLARYRITPWGATLLAIILIAPAVQFVGDWMKDNADNKSLRMTADTIRNDIDQAISTSTKESQKEITTTVRSESEQQLSAQQKLLTAQMALRDQTSEVAIGAKQILTAVNRSLYPFKDIAWAYEIRINLNHPKLQRYRDFLRQKAAEIFSKYPINAQLTPDSSVMGPTGYDSTSTFQRYGESQRLLIDRGSPLIPDQDDGAFYAVLGLVIYVDIFKSDVTINQLSSRAFRSEDYAVTLIPPYSTSYEFKVKQENFSDTKFELVYIPAAENNKDSDELLVDYYWRAMTKFEFLTEKTQSSVAGLPDLVSSNYVVRVIQDRKQWDSTSALCLNRLRMAIGDAEMTLSEKDFNSRGEAGQFVVYQKQMPADFDALMNLFTIVRSRNDRGFQEKLTK